MLATAALICSERGKLVCITEDHSVVGEMLRSKAITPEQAKTHPYRNVITRAIGTAALVEVDLIQVGKKARRRMAGLFGRIV